jgi:hypothetical protein
MAGLHHAATLSLHSKEASSSNHADAPADSSREKNPAAAQIVEVSVIFEMTSSS